MPEIHGFSRLFHQASKKIHGAGLSFSTWPQEWKTTYYKIYPRAERIQLGDKPPAADLFKAIRHRHSGDGIGGTVLKRDLSLLLKYSCGDMELLSGYTDRHSRAQPSGGARFPIEVYPLVLKSSAELVAGVYHYNVKDHALELMEPRDFSPENVDALFSYPWLKQVPVVFVMTAVFWRMMDKYGERGYRHILLEAGHIGQNLYLVAQALGLKCRALSGTRDEQIETLLDLDGHTESLVYAVAVGK